MLLDGIAGRIEARKEGNLIRVTKEIKKEKKRKEKAIKGKGRREGERERVLEAVQMSQRPLTMIKC